MNKARDRLNDVSQNLKCLTRKRKGEMKIMCPASLFLRNTRVLFVHVHYRMNA